MNQRELLQAIIDRLPNDSLGQVVQAAADALRSLPAEELLCAISPDAPLHTDDGVWDDSTVLEAIRKSKYGMSTTQLCDRFGLPRGVVLAGLNALRERQSICRTGAGVQLRYVIEERPKDDREGQPGDEA